VRNEGDIISEVFGYALWILSSGVLSEASLTISTEKQLGTLQNIMIKPYSILQISIAKTFAWFLVNCIKTMVFIVVLAFIYDISTLFSFIYLYITLMVCIGMLGVSLIFCSLTLIYTKVASFESIVSYIILMISGSIIQPPYAVVCSNPLSYGIYMATKVQKNESLAAEYGILLFISCIWFAAGLLFFKIVFSHSKQFKWTY